jgi:hypothetical protein
MFGICSRAKSVTWDPLRRSNSEQSSSSWTDSPELLIESPSSQGWILLFCSGPSFDGRDHFDDSAPALAVSEIARGRCLSSPISERTPTKKTSCPLLLQFKRRFTHSPRKVRYDTQFFLTCSWRTIAYPRMIRVANVSVRRESGADCKSCLKACPCYCKTL